MPYYFVSAVTKKGELQIMEEHKGKQVCIALVPYNPAHKYGWSYAMRDAKMIVEALNARNRNS